MTTHLFNPRYFNVDWDGPYNVEDALAVGGTWALYMISGTHSLYGRHVPLYIGQTMRPGHRLDEHGWIRKQPDPVEIYLGWISQPIQSWLEIDPESVYEKPLKTDLDQIESLLIYAHQPGYNSRGVGSPPKPERDLVIFNTGRRSLLLPEVSSMYWCS